MSSTIVSCYHTQMPKSSQFFKEESICETLTIPQQKPDIEHILDVVVWPEVESYCLVDTEIGRSYEGQNLSGVKLIVEVKLNEKVRYVADRRDQSVHAAHFESYKSVFVILPEEYNGKKTSDLVAFKSISVTPYIEAVDAKMLDSRTVQECVLLLVDVKLF